MSQYIYICVDPHTATGDFATDLAAGRWMRLSNLSSATAVVFSPTGGVASTNVQDAISELDTEKQPLDATLTALAGASTAANKIPYFSGTDTVSVTDFTAAARALLDDATAADMLTTLGALPKAGGTMTGALTLSGAPTSSLQAATKAYVDGAVTIGARNRFINGSLAIDQRNAGSSQTFTAAAAVAYCVDRWYASCTGANITGQRVSGTLRNRYAYRFTGAASNTAVLFGQRIEAANAYDLANQDITVSFQCKSSSITSLTWKVYTADVEDVFSAKTEIDTGTITISSTLGSYSFTVDSSLTANATRGIAVEFSCGALLAAETLQFEALQCEASSSASDFERRDIGEELRLCKRYCVRRQATAASQLCLPGYGYLTNVQQNYVDRFDVQMRATPTFSVSAATDFYQVVNATTVAATSLAMTAGDPWGAFLTCANNSFSNNVPSLLASQNSSAWMQYEAEL